MKYRKISVFLFLILAVVINICLTVCADEVGGTFGAQGDNLTWNLNLETGKLVIEGKGDMTEGYDFISDEYGELRKPEWYRYSKNIKEVSIGDEVTNVSSCAFGGRWSCSNIEKIHLGKSVKSIGYQAFKLCKIREIIIPENVKEIASEAFGQCANLETVICYSTDCEVNEKAFYNYETTTQYIFAGNIYCYKNSAIYDYAKKNYVSYIVMDCDHTDMILENTKKATCSEEGYTGDYICRDCGIMVITGETIEKVHKEVPNEMIKPTCMEEGSEGGTHCEYCGIVIKEAQSIPALGHTFISYVIRKETCGEDGLEQEICLNCGITCNYKISATGNHEYENYIILEPTTSREGIREYKCIVCGEMYAESIPMLEMKDENNNTENEVESNIINEKQVENRTATDIRTVSNKLKLKVPKFSVKAGRRKATVTYKKVKGATGFQIKYRKKGGKWIVRSFSTKKTIKKTIKKLNSGKKYQIKIRAVSNTKVGKVYSKWSRIKTVKVK